MRGILLAGGTGSRLRPLTFVVSKQLLPVHDKPMVYYPLSTLMLAGIREILVISTPTDLPLLRRLLGTGERLGIRLEYAVQDHPRGIAEALLIARDFLDHEPVALMLGDNLLHGGALTAILREGAATTEGAMVLGYPVADPRRYGVLALTDGLPTDIVEKPKDPPSRYAVPGLYFYDGTASDRAAGLSPSPRGELEITDLNRSYLRDGQLRAKLIGRGIAWLDMGTPAALADASAFVRTMEDRQGLKVLVPEEIAWRQGWLDDAGLEEAAELHAGSAYGDYLRGLLTEP